MANVAAPVVVAVGVASEAFALAVAPVGFASAFANAGALDVVAVDVSVAPAAVVIRPNVCQSNVSRSICFPPNILFY